MPIEVFFKEAKQLFGLRTCQSTNFDVQIAQITIKMVHYLPVFDTVASPTKSLVGYLRG